MLKENETAADSNKQEISSKDPNLYYPMNYKEKSIKDADLPMGLAKFDNIIGQDSSKRYNFYFLNDNEIITTIANTFQIINIQTKCRKIFQGTENAGVGCVALHPDKKYFAVAECGEWPNIYIYEFDNNEMLTSTQNSLKLYRILRRGTERGYTALNFSPTGDKIASVGTDPDYNLLIWNWKNESIILKAKAFSQEIFNVQFSSNFEGKLITSGIGHIKFWEMAKTFTGLKLQGELGKFGQIDLSDITAFIEFPDGKVLSGTEYGTFLLWEGIFIKAHVMISHEIKCHDGLIEYMSWENNGEKIISGAHDGYLKWWDSLDMENLDIDDNSVAFSKPNREILLVNPINKKPVKIVNLVRQSDFSLIQDGNGFLLKLTNLNTENLQLLNIYDFHAGSIIKLEFLNNSPYLFIQGRDSNTTLVNISNLSSNFTNTKNLESVYDLITTSCDISKYESDEEPLIFVVGYSIGLFRVYQFDNKKNKLELVNQIRAHEEKIEIILISPDKSYILTATRTEIFIFFLFEMDNIVPHCCIKKDAHNEIVDIDWYLDSQRILVGLNSGTVEEIEIPKTFDNTKSYVITDYSHRKFKVKLAENQLEKEDDKKKRSKKVSKVIEEPSPSPVLSCKYANLYHEGDFLLTANKPFNNCIYLCDFEESPSNPKLRPLNFWKLQITSIKEYYVKFISRSFIIITTNKGFIQIRHKNLIDKYVELYPNLLSSSIQSIAMTNDETRLAVGCKDGTTFIYYLNLEGINKYLECILMSDDNPTKIEFLKNFNIDELILPAPSEHDLLNKIAKQSFNVESEKLKISKEELLKLNSLEKEKKDDQETEKLKLADEKKNKLRVKIQKLRDDYEKIKTSNSSLHEEIRLTDNELTVDEQYLEIIKDEREANLADIKHKFDWLKANVDYTIDKIDKFFIRSVLTPKIYVFSLRSKEYVTTLRCPDLPFDFNDELEKITDKIRDFEKKIDFSSLEEQYQKYLSKKDSNKEEEDQKINQMMTSVEERIDEYVKIDHENQLAGKRADFNKNSIKEELGITNIDLEDLKKIFEDKKSVLDKLKEYLEYREKRKYSKNSKSHISVEAKKCPDSYSLKINYDTFYIETSMKTALYHKKKMYDYLNLLHNNRKEFNNNVIELRKNKEEFIKALKNKKVQLIEINGQLKIEDESFDWLDYNMVDEEFPEREFNVREEQLEKYVNDKLSNNKELSKIFESSPHTKGIGRKANTVSNESNKESENVSHLINVRERKRNINESNLESELRSINQIKLEYKKKKLIKESEKLIDDFDKKVNELRRQKTTIHFKQKLGELELLIKHEEYSILRAFETDDSLLIKKLEDLFNDYQENLKNLHSCHDEIQSKEEEYARYKEDRSNKEKDFENLIQNEKDSKEQLRKVFYQKKKIEAASNLQDDKIENEEELDLPRNISTNLKQDILNLRDARIAIDDSTEKLRVSINAKNRDKEHLINAKENLDRRRNEIREKINMNERKKTRYLNFIDFAVPLKLDQFCKLENKPVSNDSNLEIYKLPIDCTKAILISRAKLISLQNTQKLIKMENENLEEENVKFDSKYDELEKNKKSLEVKLKKLETDFQNDQILKFGLVIDFNYLLKASENKTVDKLELEYRNLKKEADNQIDDYKNKIDDMKSVLQEQLKENTHLLNEIRKLLEINKKYDVKLEEKNNEINKKSNKKFTMYNINEKKQKLKEILKLLEQQMEALKKEIEIFRRKGGHIYSTIASNLN